MIMKLNFLHITLAMVLSIMFLLAGTGYNLIHYCCGQCEIEGIEKVTEYSCEAVHHHNLEHNTERHHACEADKSFHLHQSEDACHLDRLTVDTPSIQFITSRLVDYSLVYKIFNNIFFESDIDAYSFEFSERFIPPNLVAKKAGRAILSKISILII